VRIWEADIVVDEGVVRQLLGQFPDVEARSLRPFAEGWDYAIWVVDGEWAFRFPRREVAIAGVELEIRVLPQLAPLLPLPIPAPVFVGEPTADFPWPFFGSRLLPGRELGELGLGEAPRTEVARSLAAFLRALHDSEVPGLPTDSNRRADMKTRVRKTREQLAEVDSLWQRPAALDEMLDEAEGLGPPRHEAVVHGDLHVRQLLADEEGRLTGVIDWVDLCRSDPAIDLSMYWSYFPPPARRAFLEACGPVDEAQLLRARVLALSLCAALAAYGHQEGNEKVETEALAGLDRAAAT
jgi:aminoglycoside phosphotransferase (APT) family kinase protein